MLRFSVVGCVNVAVSLFVFVLFYRYVPLAPAVLAGLGELGMTIRSALERAGAPGVDAGLANAVGYVAGMVNSFVLNKRWTFEAKGRTARQARRFVVLNVAGLAASTLAVFAFIDVLGAPYLPVWIATTAIVMVANFLGNKYWTFVATDSAASHTRGASIDARV